MTTPHCGFGFGMAECHLPEGHDGIHEWHELNSTIPSPGTPAPAGHDRKADR